MRLKAVNIKPPISKVIKTNKVTLLGLLSKLGRDGLAVFTDEAIELMMNDS